MTVAKDIVAIMTALARVEERTKHMKESNDEAHKEIISKIDKLCSHVNHENEKMDIRVKCIEETHLEMKTVWKIVLACTGGTSGLIAIIILILNSIGVL